MLICCPHLKVQGVQMSLGQFVNISAQHFVI